VGLEQGPVVEDADQRGDLLSVVCLSVILKPR